MRPAKYDLFMAREVLRLNVGIGVGVGIVVGVGICADVGVGGGRSSFDSELRVPFWHRSHSTWRAIVVVEQIPPKVSD